MIFTKILLWALGIVAIGYLGSLLFLYTKQNSLIFFPQFTRVSANQTDYALQSDGVVLRGWVVNPGSRRALIYFGGNAESIQDVKEDFARWAPQRTVYLLAYRGYGASDGVPSESAFFADALALYDEVRPHHTQIAVVGRSLGSGVAAYLASQREAERLLLITPYDSITHVAQAEYRIFPVGLLLRHRFESWRYAPKIHCPVLLIEAQNDEVIPAWSTDNLRKAFSPAPRLVRISGANHNSVSSDPEYAELLQNFLR